MSMSMPQMIMGQVAGADRGPRDVPDQLASGRALTPADEGANVTVLGSDIARQHDTQVGDTITLRGESFEVVGILEPTLTAPGHDRDRAARTRPSGCSSDRSRRSSPRSLDPASVATGFTVYPDPGADPEAHRRRDPRPPRPTSTR